MRSTYCFLCQQDVAVDADGKLKGHNPTDPDKPNVVRIRRCAGSGLSPSTTRMIAAMRALHAHRGRPGRARGQEHPRPDDL